MRNGGSWGVTVVGAEIRESHSVQAWLSSLIRSCAESSP